MKYTLGVTVGSFRTLLSLLLLALLSACITPSGGSGTAAPSTDSGDSFTAEQDAAMGDAGATDGAGDADGDGRIFRVTEDYWVDTPWFSVSSIVLKVGRTSPQTTIVLPESSIMRNYMQGDAGVVIADSFEAQRNQFLLSLGFQMEGTQAFVDDARLRQSRIFE